MDAKNKKALTRHQRKAVEAATPKTYLVAVEYTVRGTVCVFATNEDEAREKAYDEMTCPLSCDVPDMQILSVREETS